MFEQQFVETENCTTRHDGLTKLCEEKHKSVNEKLDAIGNSIKGLIVAIILEIMVMGAYLIVSGIHPKG